MMRTSALREDAGATGAAEKARPSELVSCGRCHRAYSVAAWGELPKLSTLTREEVHRHVIDWRDERVIEVRSCASCERPMARMVRMTR
jgi:cytochrome c553